MHDKKSFSSFVIHINPKIHMKAPTIPNFTSHMGQTESKW